MSESLRIAAAVEGPTDAIVLEAVLKGPCCRIRNLSDCRIVHYCITTGSISELLETT